MLIMHIGYIGAKLHWKINFTHFSSGWPLCLSLPPSQNIFTYTSKLCLHVYRLKKILLVQL